MKAMLLNLPWSEKGRFGVRAGSRWPFTIRAESSSELKYTPFPFFLAYATALLKNEGKDALLVDAIAERLGEKEVEERIKEYAPDLLVIETATPSFDNDLRIAKEIRGKIHNLKVALCGAHSGVFVTEVLTDCRFIDYILIGEYEYTLLELMNCLEEDKGGMGSVSGLAYRQDGPVIINSPRKTLENLDLLPWPEREGLPIYNYNDNFADLPMPNVQMWSTRGCPFKCSFCLWPQAIYKEHKYRKRNPAAVADEMEYLVKNFDFKAVYFDDDIFNAEKSHVVGICDEITRRKIKVPWAVMARADLMDKDLLAILSHAGLYACKYGIESADPKVLEKCGKNIDLIRVREVIKLTKELGIKVHLTFCLGLPGERKESISKTADFIKAVQPDSLQVSFATPFPGTEYYKYMIDKGFLLSENWADYDGNQGCVFRTDELTSLDLERARNDFCNNFNLQ